MTFDKNVVARLMRVVLDEDSEGPMKTSFACLIAVAGSLGIAACSPSGTPAPTAEAKVAPVEAPATPTGASTTLSVGDWCVGAKAASISATPTGLLIVNESGAKSAGRQIDASTISATDWDNLEGKISADGKVLDWANTTKWERRDPC